MFPVLGLFVLAQIVVTVGLALFYILPCYAARKRVGRKFYNTTNWVGLIGPFALLIVRHPVR